MSYKNETLSVSWSWKHPNQWMREIKMHTKEGKSLESIGYPKCGWKIAPASFLIVLEAQGSVDCDAGETIFHATLQSVVSLKQTQEHAIWPSVALILLPLRSLANIVSSPQFLSVKQSWWHSFNYLHSLPDKSLAIWKTSSIFLLLILCLIPCIN